MQEWITGRGGIPRPVERRGVGSRRSPNGRRYQGRGDERLRRGDEGRMVGVREGRAG